MWVKKPFPMIPGYESLGDNVYAKWWLDFKIHQTLDTGDPVWEYRDEFATREEVWDFVIRRFKYPLNRYGRPTDVHYDNWFETMSCHQLSLDFWQRASETLKTLKLNQKKGLNYGVGDCEDVAVVLATLFIEKGWWAQVCLGYVYRDTELLGGHGWPIFKDEEGNVRLGEATLDVPPSYPNGYPVIDLSTNRWRVGRLVYEAIVRYDREEYFEWESVGKKKVMGRIREYLSLPMRKKDTERMHRALEEAWGLPTSMMAQLRRMKLLRLRRAIGRLLRK